MEMNGRRKLRCLLAGAAAGILNGFFGGGGGMVLVPMLENLCGVEEKRAFATSVAVMLPVCVVSAAIYALRIGIDLRAALPYLAGGLAGGFLGGVTFRRVPASLLRYVFAALMIYGGVRALL